jgi:nuclear GTP-binding protein
LPIGTDILRRRTGARYKIGEFENTTGFLLQIAEKKGKLKKGGVLDLESAARTVIDDWNTGRIPYFTVPPAENESVHVDAQIVTDWSAEFDIDSLVVREAEEIEQMEGYAAAAGAVEMTSVAPASANWMLEHEEHSDEESMAVEGGGGQKKKTASDSGGGAVQMHLGSKQRLGTRRRGLGAAAAAAAAAAGAQQASKEAPMQSEEAAFDFDEGFDDGGDGQMATDDVDGFDFDDSD